MEDLTDHPACQRYQSADIFACEAPMPVYVLIQVVTVGDADTPRV